MTSKTILAASLAAALMSTAAQAQTPPNVGGKAPEAVAPFTLTPVAAFNLPWRIAFLPDNRMVVTEKVGPVWLVGQDGKKIQIANTPAVVWRGQGGMLGVFTSPKFAADSSLYLTYSEPGAEDGASSLVLARARLVAEPGFARLENLQVLWRQSPKGVGGQFGGAVAFDPDGKHLFLTVGDRQRMTPAQDPNSELGKILRLTLDGKPAAGNPFAGQKAAREVPQYVNIRDTNLAKTAKPVGVYTYPGANPTPTEVWTSGHRTPYGLAFGPDGRLWEAEHGPKTGDELNLVLKGRNYGWPEACYCVNYTDTPVPSHDDRPEFEKPKLYWTPVIAPGNIAFYKGSVFPQWNGSLLLAGMVTKTLNRITFDASGAPQAAERWNVDKRMRDVAVAPDGSVWAVEDANPGGLFKLTPK